MNSLIVSLALATKVGLGNPYNNNNQPCGLWEAGVKSFKIHLEKMSQTQKFTFEELATLLTQIESCLNSRPLSPLSEQPTNIKPLTPGHFLLDTPLLSPAEASLDDVQLNIANRWQKLKYSINTSASDEKKNI